MCGSSVRTGRSICWTEQSSRLGGCGAGSCFGGVHTPRAGGFPAHSWRVKSNAGFDSPTNSAAQHRVQVTVHIAQHITTCRSEAARLGSGLSTSHHHGDGDLRRMQFWRRSSIHRERGLLPIANEGFCEFRVVGERWPLAHSNDLATAQVRSPPHPIRSALGQCWSRLYLVRVETPAPGRAGRPRRELPPYRHGCIDRGTGVASAGNTMTKGSSPHQDPDPSSGTPAA